MIAQSKLKMKTTECTYQPHTFTTYFLQNLVLPVYDSANNIKYFTCHQDVKEVMAFPFYKIKKPGKYTTNYFVMVVILCAME